MPNGARTSGQQNPKLSLSTDIKLTTLLSKGKRWRVGSVFIEDEGGEVDAEEGDAKSGGNSRGAEVGEELMGMKFE